MKTRTQIRTIAADAALIPGQELSSEHLALVTGGRSSMARKTGSHDGSDDDVCP